MLLLDTHIVLWHLSGERPIGPAAQDAIRRCDALLVSVVSFAEIGVKASAGKLDVPTDLLDRVLDTGIELLALTPEHALRVARLPLLHRDPFDRLLVAQALEEGLTVVTADARIGAYGSSVLEA